MSKHDLDMAYDQIDRLHDKIARLEAENNKLVKACHLALLYIGDRPEQSDIDKWEHHRTKAYVYDELNNAIKGEQAS